MRFPTEAECNVIQVIEVESQLGEEMEDDVASDNVNEGETANDVGRDGCNERRRSKNKSEEFCLNDSDELNVEKVIEHLDEAENPKPGLSRNRWDPRSGERGYSLFIIFDVGFCR